MLGKKRKKRPHSQKKRKQMEGEKQIPRQPYSGTLKKFFVVIPIVIILVLSLLYFAPFLSGKKMIYGSDWLLGEYAKRAWSTDFISNSKELPMWLPHIFGGAPTFSAFFSDHLSPHTLLYLLFGRPHVHTVRVFLFVLYTFLAGLGVFLFFKELKLGIYPATFGALCYMFSGSLISTTYAGHLGRAISVSLFPLALLFIHKGVERGKFYYFIFFAGITSLAFLAGHFQMSYYATGFAIIYMIFLLFERRKERRIKGIVRITSFFVLGMVVLAMIVSISFLPVYRNLSFGARGETKGYEYTTSWSMPTAEITDIFVPEFSGIKENYWGENYFKLSSEYFGIIPLLLLAVGLFLSFRERRVKFFFIMGIIALLLSLGKNTPLFRLAYNILPGIKKFRAPSLIFYCFSFSMITVAAYGLKKIIDKENAKRILIVILSCVGCYLLFLLIAGAGKAGFIGFLKSHFSYLSIPQNTSKLQALNENYPVFIKGIVKSLVISILCFVFAFSILKKNVKPLIAVPILLIVLLVDQWYIEKRFLKGVPHPSEYYRKDGVISYLEKDRSNFRIFPIHYRRSNDGILILYGIQSLGGYHPNPLRRYQELIGAGESVMFNPSNLLENPKLIDILNGKYIIGVPLPPESLDIRFDERTRESIKIWRNFFSRFTPVQKVSKNDTLEYVIYRNDSIVPRAFFAPRYEVNENKEMILQYMTSDEFDPLHTVLLEEEPGIPPPDTVSGGSRVSIEEYGVNEIRINAEVKERGFLVLSENFYPRWKAYVDGEKVKVFLANYTMRAVVLEKGEHTVLFRYEDGSYTVGKMFMIFGMVILLFAFIFQFFDRRSAKIVAE
jgi:hypothetical protein